MSSGYDQNLEELKLHITKLSRWLWGERIKESNIEAWLKNFTGEISADIEQERLIALSLLGQFMFYDLREIRQALKSIFNELYKQPIIHLYRKNTGSTNISDYETFFKEELKNTRFLTVGNPSESSGLLLYFFRQINNIPKDYFIESCKLFSSEIKDTTVELTFKNENLTNLVFIDDLSGSGDQASRELKDLINTLRKVSTKKLNISYFTLFATTKALQVLRETKLFDDVQSIFELDATYRVFESQSRYLTDKKQRICFKKLCIKDFHTRCAAPYVKKHHCGYGDSQLLLGFFYNIPNNTLPIFWAETESWQPLFKRYDKNYRLGI